MVKGLYTSGVGMMTQMNRMDVITNNIANAGTNGYKKETAIVQSFPDELAKRLDDGGAYKPMTHAVSIGNLTYGASFQRTATDFSQGGLQNTGNPLDVSIEGEGFFVVETTDRNGDTSEKYTRDGSFSINAQGELITKDGKYILGNGGKINIPTNVSSIIIQEDGTILADQQILDQLKMVSFENPETLTKFGDNLYDIGEGTTLKDFNGNIIQGFIETSNTNIVREMVEMITISRVYEANSKAIQTHDQTLAKSVELGKK